MTQSNDVTPLLLEGFELARAGKSDEAEALYRAALAADPRNVHALNLLGALLVNRGEASAALPMIARAVAIAPGDADAHLNLGLAQKDIGRLRDALGSFRTAARLAPMKLAATNYVSSVCYDLGEHPAAANAARAVLARHRDNVPALINLSRSLLQMNQPLEAIAAAERALALDQANGGAACALGDAYCRSCRYDAALDAYALVPPYDRSALDAALGRVGVFRERGDLTDAAAAAATAIACWPAEPRVHFAQGVLFEQSGRIEDARGSLRRCLALAPGDAAALYQLIQLPGHLVDDGQVELLQTMLDDPQGSRDRRRLAAFGLARCAEARGEYERALELFAVGHTLIADGQTYADEATGRFYQAIAAAAGPQPGEVVAPIGSPSPIFVVGLPRSGTSLCEQILASHSDVLGMGESSFLQDAVARATRLTGASYPACVARLTSVQRRDLGREYRERLTSGHTGVRFVIDKTPLNFQYLAFALAILPDARFVHCRRDPADNCLSIFRLPFERSQSYAHDLQALASHYRRYETLMQFWFEWLGDRLLTLQYEQVVAEFEAQAHRLLAFLNLPFEQAVLEFHRTDRLVRTPSTSQVRQPIYRDSVSYWRRYGPRMAPLAALVEASASVD